MRFKEAKGCLNGFMYRFLHTEHISKASRTNDAVKLRPSSSKSSKVKDARLSLASRDKDIVRWNIAITDYMRKGQYQSAIDVFNSMPRRNIVSWNSMICGFLWSNLFDQAKKMFDRMPERDIVSWNVMISACIRYHNLTQARMLFEQMPEKDVVSWNAMLSGYAHNGYVDEAREVFDRMPDKNSISWNGILAAYVQNGRIEEAGQLFDSRADWHLISWNCLMAGYVRNKNLMDAKILFDKMPERDVVSWNTMISGFAQNGNMSEARRLFNESPVRDVFTWTAMVSGYVQNGMLEKAKHVFDEMPGKNSVSWNAMIAGYVQCGKMDSARKLFDSMPCRNVSTWNTMISGYAQCGDISFSRKLFDEMPERDCVSYAAIIAGYAQSGLHEEALHLFLEMKRIGKVNRSSITCILSSCADIAALELGKQVHGRSVKAGFEGGYFVGNAVLSMYCKCGSIEEAYEAFEEINKKDVVSWNTMIHGYGIHGFGKEALQVFNSMKLAGAKPDEATMVAVLSACSHTGLVDKGKEFFYSMKHDYGIIANSKHYTCMIDLLGRAGCLDEAMKLIQNIPFEPDAAMWGALLGASRIYGNTELGEKAARQVFEMQPENSGMYILLSNLYASYGRWRDADKMRLEMQTRGVKKVPGCSWMEVQKKIHTFCVGDCHHPERERIYALLDELDVRMKLEGYVSSTKLVLHDVEEEEKEQMLRYHSEKLAVAFGILNVPSGRPIRVMKNLRVCQDCHDAIKCVSKIVGRLIIVRDPHRFHHFSHGQCSCGDYW